MSGSKRRDNLLIAIVDAEESASDLFFTASSFDGTTHTLGAVEALVVFPHQLLALSWREEIKRASGRREHRRAGRMPTVMGIDAAAGQWLAIILVDGAYASAELRLRVKDLLAAHPEVAVVAIDIPIGLPTGADRAADLEARKFVGGRLAASVFPTPPAEVLTAESYHAAADLAERLVGHRISRQSYGLRHRIFEVAAVSATDRRLVEVHPEVSFRALKRQPLRSSKHTWSALHERRGLLADAGIELPSEMPGGGRISPDDVLDAAIAAWSAERVALGRSGILPSPPLSDPARGGVIHF